MENYTKAEELFSIWTREPGGSSHGWTRWVSPVLFYQLNKVSEVPVESPTSLEIKTDWAPSPSERTLAIVDLPGEKSVEMGMALARKGYRPVPLFNGCPKPEPSSLANEVVPMQPLVKEFMRASREMRSLSFAPDAPPAFLLDSNRMSMKGNPAPGDFDNRWVILPEDFPSANYVLAAGLRRAIAIREGAAKQAQDLAHVLYRWKKAGVELTTKEVDNDSSIRPFEVAKPSSFKSLFYASIATLGLGANAAGGFGYVIPTMTSSSHSHHHYG